MVTKHYVTINIVFECYSFLEVLTIVYCDIIGSATIPPENERVLLLTLIKNSLTKNIKQLHSRRYIMTLERSDELLIRRNEKLRSINKELR
jgi:hypothetical protein